VVPRQQKDHKRSECCGGSDGVAYVEPDVLLNIDDQRVGHAAADVGEPDEPVEERVDRLLTEPLHLQPDRWYSTDEDEITQSLKLNLNPLTPTVAIWVQLKSILCQPDRAQPSFVIFDIRAL